MYAIDLTKAANAPQMSSIVRMTAQQILSNDAGYFKPGDWLRNLSSPDLYMLIAAMEMMTDSEDDPLSEQAVALAVILSQGEGSEIQIDMLPRVAFLVQILMMEALARKGMIDMIYDNISFDEGAGEVQIATPRYRIANPDTEGDAPSTGE